MKELLERFGEFWQKMQKEGKFSAREFVAFMEPAFEAAGYRQVRSRGERARILVIRDDAAGDFVLFSGFLRELRRVYPGAHITLVVSPRSKELAECCPYVDNLELNQMGYDPADFPAAFRSTLDFTLERLLDQRFDLAFCARLGIRSMSVLMEYMSGARQRVAYSQDRIGPGEELQELGWDGLLTTPVPFPREPWHDVDMDLYVLEHVLQLPIVERSIEVWYTQQDIAFARERLAGFLKDGRRILAVVPGASMKGKQWPVENYVEVLRAIHRREPKTAFLVLGGPDDMQAAQQLQAALGKGRVKVMAGAATFRQSAALLSFCQVYVGNDTGLLHIAAALGMPVLTVNCFPDSLPRVQSSIPVRFYPYQVPSVVVLPAKALDGCADNYRYGCARTDEVHCIRQVKPETVLQGYEVLLHRIQEKAKEPIFLK